MRLFILICSMFVFWFSEGVSLVPYGEMCDCGKEPMSDFD